MPDSAVTAMDKMRIIREEVQGFRVVGLDNDLVAVRVMPQLGAKISSLVNLLTRREWMWAPPGGPLYRRQPTGSPFEESSLTGADECIPTIAACRWRDLDLPDHGEAWTEAWSIDETALVHGHLVTRLNLPVSPLSLRRIISLSGHRVQLQYELSNHGATPFEFVWAFHPLIALQPGDAIRLPCREVRVDTAISCPLGPPGSFQRWPEPLPGVRLDHIDFGPFQGAAVKLYAQPTTGEAAIVNVTTGDALTFLFAAAKLKTLGIWINRGGWGGYHHVALEPATGSPDRLDVAVNDWGSYACVDPHGTFAWEFAIALSA